MIGEFRAFLLKTNALALAVGVILGAAMGNMVNALVNDVIMPPIGLLLGGVDFSQLKIVLQSAGADHQEVAISYGSFLNTVISFVVIALVVFLIARQLMKEPPAPEVKTCKYCKQANEHDASRCRFCTSEI